MTGLRVGIFGLGRSGLGVGRACLAKGAKPHVYDETPASGNAKPELLAEAEAIGLPVISGWTGNFSKDEIDLLVTNPAVDHRHPKLQAALAEGIEILSEVEFAFRISAAPVVAITGTNGKSTTTVMTWLCLREAGIDAVLCGNIYGSGFPEQSMTEAALNATADQVLVAEISSFQLEWVSQFRPVSAGITTITDDHLNRYNGFADYAATKHRVWAAMGPGDFTVAPADDPEIHAPVGPELLAFGPGLESDHPWLFMGHALDLSRLRVRGTHNRRNAAMAISLAFGAVAATRGREVAEQLIPKLYQALLPFEGLKHRMEPLGEKDGVEIINNSMCTNPDAVVKSALSLGGKRAHLLIGGKNKELGFDSLQKYLHISNDAVYLYGSDAPDLQQMLGRTYPIFSTLKQAFECAIQEAISGEVVMLAPGCASSDQFKDFRDRGDAFREIATEWLRS